MRLRREPADRAGGPARLEAEDALPTEEVGDARHDDDRGARRPSSACPSRAPRRPRSSWPATAGSSSRSCGATTTSTRRSSSTRSRSSAGCVRRTVEEITARGHGARLRLADRRARRGRRGRRHRRRAPRTSSPARTSAGLHLRNMNVPRDYTPDVVADIANVREGDPCPDCGSPVILRNGHRGRQHLQARDGVLRGAGRVVPRRGRRAAPDRDGLVRHRRWAATSPASSRRTTTRRASSGRREVAPYAAHLVALSAIEGAPGARGRGSAPRPGRSAAAHEILYDDRDESPGVKFNDAELLGMPTILTV